MIKINFLHFLVNNVHISTWDCEYIVIRDTGFRFYNRGSSTCARITDQRRFGC